MNDKNSRSERSGESKTNGKKQCEHEPARIWLASNNYKEAMYCRKCLELLHAKKARQESP